MKDEFLNFKRDFNKNYDEEEEVCKKFCSQGWSVILISGSIEIKIIYTTLIALGLSKDCF